MKPQVATRRPRRSRPRRPGSRIPERRPKMTRTRPCGKLGAANPTAPSPRPNPRGRAANPRQRAPGPVRTARSRRRQLCGSPLDSARSARRLSRPQGPQALSRSRRPRGLSRSRRPRTPAKPSWTRTRWVRSVPSWRRCAPRSTSGPGTCSGSPPSTRTTASGSTGTAGWWRNRRPVRYSARCCRSSTTWTGRVNTATWLGRSARWPSSSLARWPSSASARSGRRETHSIRRGTRRWRT